MFKLNKKLFLHKSIYVVTLSLFLVGCSSNEGKLSNTDITDLQNVDIEEVEVDEVDLTLETDELDKNEEVTSNTITEENKTNTNSNEVKEEVQKKPVHTDGTTQKIPVEYVRIVDGDTAKVVYDGQEMSVRYLLIDTPESKHNKIGYQPYGDEASEYNKKLLDNANQVYLEFDVGARQDHYGRLLAYVWADDILVNEAIVREGLAIKAYVKPPSTRYLDKIEKAQELAKSENKNVWSLPNFVQGEDFKGGSKVDGNKDYPQFIKEDTKQNTPTKKEPTKNTSVDTNNGDNNFKNCTELRKVYPEGVPSNHPAYQAKMDRDKDGWACE